METYHKISTPFKRDMDGSITGQKGKLIVGDWARPEFAYLADNEWEFTEKVDGTNIRVELRVIRTDDKDTLFATYGGRTDNAVISKPLLEHLEATFPTYPLYRRDLSQPAYRDRWNEVLDWMNDANLEHVVLYGEGYGPKIQGGGKYRSDHSFVLFDVKIGDFWLDRDNVNDVASKLGIDSVPVLGRGTLWDAMDIVCKGKYWDSASQAYRYFGNMSLRSAWGDFEAEGIVARPVVPLFNRKGERIITKIKAVDFR